MLCSLLAALAQNLDDNGFRDIPLLGSILDAILAWLCETLVCGCS